MSKSIVDRMGGKMDHGCFVTIRGVADYLGVGYSRAQRILLEAYRGGDLIRHRVERCLIYSSRQRALFSAVELGAGRRRKSPPTAPRRRPRVTAEENQLRLL